MDNVDERLKAIEKNLQQILERSASSKKADDTRIGFKELIGVMVSLSAFVTALFYFTGHAFMLAFFQEMNIPFHLFNLSLWQYGEVGWRYVAAYLFKAMIYGLLVVTAIGFVVLGASLIKSWIPKRYLAHKAASRWQLSEFSSKLLKHVLAAVQLLFWMIVGFTVIVLIISAATDDARNGGLGAGHDAILNAQHLTLITNHPLDIPDGATVKTSSDETLYRYDGLYVLLYNDNRYFAYRTLGPSICRPEQVFIVEAEQVQQAILSSRPTSAPACP